MEKHYTGLWMVPGHPLIVCVGMAGYLAMVVAGLLPQPLIAVPVSVGYGVSSGGHVSRQA